MKRFSSTLTLFIAAAMSFSKIALAGPAVLTANIGTGAQSGVISGEWAMVGNTTNCSFTVHQFNYATPGWTLTQAINPSGSNCNGNNQYNGLPSALSVSGSYAVVGANTGGGTPGPGNVFVYLYSGTWGPAQTITGAARLLVDGSRFGSSVWIDGDLLIVGAPLANGAAGAAYIYRLNAGTWTFASTLNGTAANDQFGTSVTLFRSGSTIRALVGAPLSGANDAGSVTVYDVSAVGAASNRTEMAPSPALANENMGREVAMYSTTSILASGVRSHVFTFSGTWTNVRQVISTNAGVAADRSVSAFGIATSAVRAQPDPTDSTYAVDASVPISQYVRMYKNSSFSRNATAVAGQSLVYPCGFGSKLLPTRWNIVNVPCNVAGKTINQVFNATGALGTYGTNWEVWGQDGTDYTSGSSTRLLTAATVVNAVSQGQAYWLKHTNASAVYWFVDSTQSTAFTPILATNPAGVTYSANVAKLFAYTLPTVPGRGRALISNPFPRSFKWSDVHYSADGGTTATTLATAVTANRLNNGIAYVYDPSILVGQPYRAVASGVPGVGDTIEVNEGFWIRMGTTPSGNDRLLLPLTK